MFKVFFRVWKAHLCCGESAEDSHHWHRTGNICDIQSNFPADDSVLETGVYTMKSRCAGSTAAFHTSVCTRAKLSQTLYLFPFHFIPAAGKIHSQFVSAVVYVQVSSQNKHRMTEQMIKCFFQWPEAITPFALVARTEQINSSFKLAWIEQISSSFKE